MIDETSRTYGIRCRWCADSVMIDVPFGVKAQAGHVECTRGHVTPYRFDGTTVLTEERRGNPRSTLPYEAAAPRAHAGS